MPRLPVCKEVEVVSEIKVNQENFVVFSRVWGVANDLKSENGINKK